MDSTIQFYDEQLPYVTVVIPVRNEAQYIRYCLDAILKQDYSNEHVEVIIVDGLSDDGTREIIGEYVARHAHIYLVDNPKRIVPPAMNIGIRQAKGEIIVRVDGRCIIEPDYIRQCVHHLQQTKAHNVGGRQQAVGENFTTQTIALAITSPFGMGNSTFRYATQSQFVDTVYLGAFPKSTLIDVGLYDETFVRNQDYELNYRIRQAGGKIYFTPDIKSVYYGRPSLLKLWKQYFQYGFWKTRVLRKHPKSVKVRQLVAPMFVLSLICGMLLIPFRWGRFILFSVSMSYGLATSLASIIIGYQSGWRYAMLLPIVFVILHVSWGLGFLWGMVTGG